MQSWIYQMTRNAIADYFRKKNNLSALEDQEEKTDEEERNAMKEATGWIGFYVNSLPENYREALVMYENKRFIAEKKLPINWAFRT